jgi:hypothetical protein
VSVWLWLLLALPGCGNDDTVWTGLSGILIFGVAAVILISFIRHRK